MTSILNSIVHPEIYKSITSTIPIMPNSLQINVHKVGQIKDPNNQRQISKINQF
jgi:hypothetical protein